MTNDYAEIAAKAHAKRQAQKDLYVQNVEPTDINGIIVRSRLEALWIEQFTDCGSLECIECVQLPIWIDGPYGRFLSNYKPDFKVIDSDGQEILVELKPTPALALEDDRQIRALELNPRVKFLVIGGYPYSKKGVLVRLLTGKKEIVHEDVNVYDVLRFLGCETLTQT